MSTKLAGWAIDLGIFNWEHTYVRVKVNCDDYGHFDYGRYWPCWGTWKSEWGREICIDEGSQEIADRCALIPPSMKNYPTAGIIYLVNGVCHQTANRILIPAGVKVSKAGGYGLSSFFYGDYGADFLAFLMAYVLLYQSSPIPINQKKEEPIDLSKIKIDPPQPFDDIDDIDRTIWFQKIIQSAYDQNVLDLYSNEVRSRKPGQKITMEENYSLLRKETCMRLEFLLGDSLSSHEKNSVLNQQEYALKEMEKEKYDLLSGHNNIDKYVKEVNELGSEVIRSLPDIMGPREFEVVFDSPPLKKDFSLFNPHIAAEYLKNISYK